MLQKSIEIKGMSCKHCSNRVEKALNAIQGVHATVDLDSNSAKLMLENDISNDVLQKVVEDAGYNVVSID